MKVSIIIPYYNGEKYLSKLLHILNINYHKLAQISCEMEVLLINDSPWNEIVVSNLQYDFTLKIINNEKNSGIHKTRVNGLLHAEGQMILFLDQDDSISEDAILSQVVHLKDFDFVICNGYYEYENGEKREIYQNENHQACCLNIDYYYGYDNPIASPGQILIKKEVIPSDWIRHSLTANGADDYYLWLLLLENNRKGAINPDRLYTHVYTGNNASLNLKVMTDSDKEVITLLQGKVDPQRLNKFKRRVDYYSSNYDNIFTKIKYLDVWYNRRKFGKLKKG